MIKTFTQKNPSVEKNKAEALTRNGFSLIEISIVLLIIGGLLAVALPRLSINKTDTRKVIREITTSVKEIRNRAKLYGTTYRLAFRLDTDHQAYWVEKSTNITFIDKDALEKARNEAKSSFRNDEKAAPSPFQPDTSFFKKEKTLPKGYTFKMVESAGGLAVNSSGSSQNISYSDGMAYIHFFPQGFIEAALIQIEDPKKNTWSVTFNSLTGKAAIFSEAKQLKDFNP